MGAQQDQQMETVNVSIEQAKEAIAGRNTVRRLTQNKDFSTIIEKGYFQDEASRLTLLMADPVSQTKDAQLQIRKDLEAIGRLRQYIIARLKAGDMAEKALIDHEAMREELAAEED